ncbi:hypothetical protein V8G54_037039 [Vigna mungo]|uniref:Uncharacterized protein n=1 Tax=Vigna mungo TaxID=3915 RepID=A0AAQ3RH46_VIGMU
MEGRPGRIALEDRLDGHVRGPYNHEGEPYGHAGGPYGTNGVKDSPSRVMVFPIRGFMNISPADARAMDLWYTSCVVSLCPPNEDDPVFQLGNDTLTPKKPGRKDFQIDRVSTAPFKPYIPTLFADWKVPRPPKPQFFRRRTMPSATPPPVVLSRGIGWQVIGILLNDLFGTLTGSTDYDKENVELLGSNRIERSLKF